MKKLLVKKDNLSNSRGKGKISPMSARGFTNRYKEYITKQNKKTIVALSATIAMLLFVLAFAVTFPFRDELYNRLFPKDSSFAAGIPPTYIQSIDSQISTPGTQVSTSWTTATTQGNFLIAILTANAGGGGVTVSSAPANWVKASENNHGGVYQFVYYYANAPSQTGQVNFSLSTNAKASLVISEYKDVESASPLDTQVTASGTNLNPTNSLNPSQAERFLIHAISAGDSTTFASASAGFSITSQQTTTGGAAGTNASSALAYLYTTSTSSVTSSVSLATSSAWVSTLLSFKVKQQATTVASTDWPQLQHDAQHTGRTTVGVDPSYEVAWAWTDKNHIVKNFVNGAGKSLTDGFESGFSFTNVFSQQMQPIVAAGRAYFSSMNGVLYAVNAATGDNVWDFTTGGHILGTAAYDSATIIIGSMDGKLYGVHEANGTQKWAFTTGAGISASPIVSNGVAYVGSRDGSFYAINVSDGSLKWKYDVRDPNNSDFNKAPIVAPAALSEDGSTVVFGAENMHVYALNTSNGSEKWGPKKVVGQSFLYAWPVIKGDKVVIRTMSSLYGAEETSTGMEQVLDGLPSEPAWSEEKTAILNHLTQNPRQKSLYVFDLATGNEPYQVAMGRVTGNNYAAHPPVVDNQNRLLTYWRAKRAYFLSDGATFGTKYCPDVSGMDLSTGDRVRLGSTVSSNGFCPELDNGFGLTVGGNYLYFQNSFRGVNMVNLTNRAVTRVTTSIAKWDGGDFRGWGYNVIYYGNDSQPTTTTTDPRPPRAFQDAIGFSGVSIASVNNTPMLFVTESDAGFVVALRHKP